MKGKVEYSYDRKRYEWNGKYEDRDEPKTAGFWWDSLNRVWYAPTVYVADKLLGKKRDEEKANKSYAVNCEYYPIAPQGLSYRDYQRAGIEFLVTHHNCLLADDPGSGKTIQVAGLLNSVAWNHAFILCPASLVLNWKRELEKWLVVPKRIYAHVKPNTKAAAKTIADLFCYDVVIMGYEAAVSFFKKNDNDYPSFDIVVADESHYLKTEKAQRTKTALSLLDRAIDRRVLMTGTPILNRPIELWTTIRLLDPKGWKGKRQFFSKYFCEGHKEYIRVRGGMTREIWVEDGACHIEELNAYLRDNFMIRRRKADILPFLPPKIKQNIEVLVSCSDVTKERKQYERMVKMYGEERALDMLLGDADGAAMTEMAEIRHNIALAKAPKVVEFVRTLLDEDANRKVIIFAHHRDVVNVLKEAFGENAVFIVGGMSAEDKQKAVDDFQNKKEIRVFIGNMHAAGVGLTLTAADTVVFAELDFTPGVMEQCEDRAHRIGQDHEAVRVFRIVIEGSLDEYLLDILDRKEDIYERVTK